MKMLKVVMLAKMGCMSGFGYGVRNSDSSWLLEFADGLNLVICNTIYEAGDMCSWLC